MLRFTFLELFGDGEKLRKFSVQQLQTILDAVYNYHAETAGAFPSAKHICQTLGQKWYNGSKHIGKVLKAIRAVEAEYWKHKQSTQKLSGILELDASSIGAFVYGGK